MFVSFFLMFQLIVPEKSKQWQLHGFFVYSDIFFFVGVKSSYDRESWWQKVHLMQRNYLTQEVAAHSRPTKQCTSLTRVLLF